MVYLGSPTQQIQQSWQIPSPFHQAMLYDGLRKNAFPEEVSMAPAYLLTPTHPIGNSLSPKIQMEIVLAFQKALKSWLFPYELGQDTEWDKIWDIFRVCFMALSDCPYLFLRFDTALLNLLLNCPGILNCATM